MIFRLLSVVIMSEYANAEELLKSLPEDRRQRIEEGARMLAGGCALKQIRKEAGLTQKDVASRLGITQPTVSSLEDRYAEARVSTLKRYCETLGAELTITIATKDGKTYALP